MGKQVLLQFRLQLQSPAKALASCECPCLLSHHSRWLFARGDQGYKIYQHVFFGTFGILDCILEVLFSVYLSEKSCGIALPPQKKAGFKCFTNLAFHPNLSNEKLRGIHFFEAKKSATRPSRELLRNSPRTVLRDGASTLLPQPRRVGDQKKKLAFHAPS